MAKSLKVDFDRAYWVIFLCLIPFKKSLSPSSLSLSSMGNLSPLGKFIGIFLEETISPSGEVIDLSGGTSIKPSKKTGN